MCKVCIEKYRKKTICGCAYTYIPKIYNYTITPHYQTLKFIIINKLTALNILFDALLQQQTPPPTTTTNISCIASHI